MCRLLPFLLLLTTIPATANADDETPRRSPEKVAMQFATAAFLDRDVETAMRFVHRDAERKTYGKGSVIRDLQRDIPRLPVAQAFVLQEIHFAHSHELERIARHVTAFSSERDGAKQEDASVFVSERDGVKQVDTSVNVELLRKELRVGEGSFVACLIWRYVPSRAREKRVAAHTLSHMLFVFEMIDGEYKVTYASDD